MTSKLKPPARRSCTAKMMTQMPSTSQVRIFESWLSLICSGVWPCSALERASAILPISVSMPVAVMTAVPRPYTTVEPIYTMFLRSPSGTSFVSGARLMMSINLLTGTLSPVRAASSIFMLALVRMRPSAGIASPASRITTSPTTRSSLWMVTIFPSRSTLDVAADICCRASMAFSALLS